MTKKKENQIGKKEKDKKTRKKKGKEILKEELKKEIEVERKEKEKQEQEEKEKGENKEENKENAMDWGEEKKKEKDYLIFIRQCFLMRYLKNFLVRHRKKFFWLSFFCFVFLLIGFLIFYLFPSLREKFSLIKRAPFPVAWVEGAWITSSQIDKGLEAVKNFYTNQDFASAGLRVDFSTEAGKERLKIREKDVLDKLVEDQLVKKICQTKGIVITDQDVEADLNNKLKEGGVSLDQLELNLKSLYGLSVDEFKEKVIAPQIRIEQLFQYWQEREEKKKTNYEKIRKVQKALQDGEDFSELAKKYSEGESAKEGGEMGWFRKEMLISPVAETIFSLKKGEISQIIESPLGYHLIKIEDIREVEEEETKNEVITKKERDCEEVIKEGSGNNQGGKKTVKEIKISQIFVRSDNFNDWLKEEKSKFKVLVFDRQYQWDKENYQVIFRQTKMRVREEELRKRGLGDPTL